MAAIIPPVTFCSEVAEFFLGRELGVSRSTRWVSRPTLHARAGKKHGSLAELMGYKPLMHSTTGIAVVTLGLILLMPASAQMQVGGNLASGPPLDLFLEITTGDDGPALSVSEFELITGEYYRLNVTSDGVENWRLEVTDLLQNSHLRIVTISEIEVHLQSLVFRAIEFDVAGSARFSFTPVRTGTFEFSVGDTPSGRRRRGGEGRVALGRFVVE